MNDLENYKNIVASIFGDNTIDISKGYHATNNILSALNNKQFYKFTECYKQRLNRLKKIYSSHNNYKDILITISQVADSKNWEGAYAEIVSYDYLNSSNHLMSPIKLEKMSIIGNTKRRYI